MKTFKVLACMTTTLICEIEADNEKQAWMIAKNMDGGSFTALPDVLWDIADVSEIEE
jgi:hypothetical protein